MESYYLHLIRNENFVPNLKRLTGGGEEHRITVFNDETPGPELLETARSSKAVFVHFLDYGKAKFVNALDASATLIWFFWGGDGYYLGKFDHQFLLPKTKKLRFRLNVAHAFGGHWRDLLKMGLGPWSDYIYPNNEVLKAARNMDIIVPVIPQDYRLLAAEYDLPGEMFHVNYINDVFASRPDVPASANRQNVLVGNSASFSNNHVELIDHLSGFDSGNRQYIFPLSYGKGHYGDYIEQYALDRLGTHAKILREMLPLDEYRTLFESCDTLMMNHCRQQGLGNIVMALWYEMTIFLNRRSGLYEYLAGHDFHILDIDAYRPGTLLPAEKLRHNKSRMFEVFGPERQRAKFGELLRKIETL